MANLIVGVGGTGGKVIKALREHVARTRGDEDENHYLCLDTMTRAFFLDDVYGNEDVNTKAREGGNDLDDATHVSDYDQEVRKAVLPTPIAVNENEYLQLRGMTSELLNRLRKDPHSENGRYSWLEADYLVNQEGVRERVFQFKEGAGQYRHIGRIGSFMTAKELDPWLSSIGDIENVYLVCSVAGGTGSGNFIDVAAMIRHVLYRNTGEQPQISLLLLMPGAFANDAATDDYTSAYAAMRELRRIQSPTIKGVPLCFEYEGVPRFSLDVNLYDQVTLLDYESKTEDERRNTVYPKIAEMLDLLTAGGTSVVNSQLVNVNKIVRELQQGKEHLDADQDTRSAWKNRSNEPYFCQFDSFRIMIPVRPYKLKAASMAAEKLILNLVGESLSYSQPHHDTVVNWFREMPGTLEADFFGRDAKLEDVGFSVPGKEDFRSVTSRFFEQKEKRNAFMNISANILYDACTVLLAGQIQAYSNVDEVLTDSLSTSDRKLAKQKLDEINSLRKEYFAVSSLESIDHAEGLREKMGGRYGEVLMKAVNAYNAKISDFYREHVGTHLKAKPGGLRELQMVLLGLQSHFIRPLTAMISERNEVLRSRLSAAKQQVLTLLQEYNQLAQQEKKGIFKDNRFKECSAAYVDSERHLFDALLAYLSNHALGMQLEHSLKMTETWAAEISRVLDTLGKEEPGTLLQCTRRAVREMDKQLDTWVRSDAVSIGFPHAVIKRPKGTPEEIRGMYGLEEKLYREAMEHALTFDNCIWGMDNDSKRVSLKLSIATSPDGSSSKEVQFGTTGFKDLHRILISRFSKTYDGWTLEHYLDYLSEEGHQRDELSKALAEFLANTGMIKTEGVGQIVSKLYIVCPNESDRFILNLLKNDMSGKGVKASAIQVQKYSYELTLVKMSAGYVETDYKSLSSAKEQYVANLKYGSKSLKIRHILPEEINLVEFEQERFRKSPRGDDDIMMPSRLSVLFSNKELRYLFTGLFAMQLIDFYDDPDRTSQSTQAYWCYIEVKKIREFLADPRKLIEFLKSSGSQGTSPNDFLKSHAAFRLNFPLEDSGKDSADFFVAMARFVQKAENAQSGHMSKKFPFTITDVRELLRLMETFLNGTRANGLKRYEVINNWIQRISPGAIRDEAWLAEGKDVPFFARTYGLDSNEEKEKFAEQLSALFEEYYQIVKRPERSDTINLEDEFL